MFVPIAWWIVCWHIASAIVLVVTRVQFPYRGPLLIPLASLHPVLSCLLSILSCPLKSKDHKYNLEKKSKCMVIINMITIWFISACLICVFFTWSIGLLIFPLNQKAAPNLLSIIAPMLQQLSLVSARFKRQM